MYSKYEQIRSGGLAEKQTLWADRNSHPHLLPYDAVTRSGSLSFEIENFIHSQQFDQDSSFFIQVVLLSPSFPRKHHINLVFPTANL